jgi:SAM-dependent methyltransferase
MESTSVILEKDSEFFVRDGIARRRSSVSENQVQTADTFGFKWKKRETYESPAMHEMSRKWLLERYSLPGKTILELVRGKRVLDAGCGSGYSALLLFADALKSCEYVGVDISTAVDVARERFREKGYPGDFVQTPLELVPKELGPFDIIFSEGVLHHTDSTENAVRSLSRHLKPGGLFMFYIYRKKAPVREFVDDYIRDKIAPLSNDEAWEALRPLSELGKILGDLHVKLKIEKPIDLLDIPAGEVDLQRFFYWYICKAFYREDWSLDEMNHINFDWYRPKNCHRHSVDEVRAWLSSNKLSPLKLKEEEAGITVIV